MSNLETLFKKSSANDIRSYQQCISNLRKHNKTRDGKICSIVNQVKYMHKMFNTGHQLGGNESNVATKITKDMFNDYSDKDINYIFKTIHIPYSKSKKSILGNVQSAYKTIQFLDF